MRCKFLIVGTQRTGSQALYKAFNLHPEVFCGGEWTLRVPWHRKLMVANRALSGEFEEVLLHRPQDRRRISDSLTCATKWLGFKILFRSSAHWLVHPRLAPALTLDRLEDHMNWLRSRPDIHVIHLVRRDIVDWLKSKYLARAVGTHTHKQYPDQLTVRIPIQQALRAATSKKWVDSRLSTLARGRNPYHVVHYEDFLAGNRQTLEACLLFLHCDPQHLPDHPQFIQRQSKTSVADYIENYNDLVDALKDRNLL